MSPMMTTHGFHRSVQTDMKYFTHVATLRVKL